MNRKPYLRGKPGKLSPRKQRIYGLALLGLRRKFFAKHRKIPTSLSYKAIANKVGVLFSIILTIFFTSRYIILLYHFFLFFFYLKVFSATTVYNWDKLDMSEDGIKYRARLKAPEPKFSSDEEGIIVGWIMYQDLAMLSSTTTKLREYDCFLFSYHLLCMLLLYFIFTESAKIFYFCAKFITLFFAFHILNFHIYFLYFFLVIIISFLRYFICL
jgi:hypothetical protein